MSSATAEPVDSGWQRIKTIYTDSEVHIEKQATLKMFRLSFIAGFLYGGYSGHMLSKQRFEEYNLGRKYISPRDALRRKWDYSLLMFAKNGCRMGLRSAAVVGSVVFLTTHLAAWRNRFSFWYFPVISGANALLLQQVGSVLSFPLGPLGSIKAACLGVTSGLSLSLVLYLYSLNLDKSIDEGYKTFKADFEEEVREEWDKERRIEKFMKENSIYWKYEAIRQMRQADERRLLEDEGSD